ncbi:MAG TPA: TolC family protein [Gemmatimonadales bacterium]|nr:TolC family protein [Gemmatimonadales bacterium]
MMMTPLAFGLLLAVQDPTPLTLDQAVSRALDRYPSVLAARARRDAARAGIGEATAAWWPRLSVDGSAVRHQEPMIVAPLHGFDPTRPPEFDPTLLQGNVALSYTLFDGGVRSARVRQARAARATAEAGVEAAEAELIASVTTTYLGALTARGVLEAHDRRLAALTGERARVTQLLAEGTAAQVELLRVDAALAAAAADRVTAQQQLSLALRELARLVEQDRRTVTAGSLRAVRLADTSRIEDEGSLITRARAANPDVERARQAVVTARAAHAAARAAWFPEIRLQGAYLGYGSGAGDFIAEWQGGARVSFPVFTGGARGSASARAAAQARSADSELALAERRIEAGVDQALSVVTEAATRRAALAAAVGHLMEVVRIERLRLEAGAGVQTDYLRAEAELLSARASELEARHAEISARVELARVTGDLTPAVLRRIVETTS